MFELLNRLFGADVRARWRIIGISGAVIAAWGFVGQRFTDAPFVQIQTGATVAGLMAFAAQILFYCFDISFQSLAPIRLNRVRVFQSLAAIAATAILALLSEISLPRVQAAVLTKRLRGAMGLKRAELRAAAMVRVFQDAEQARIHLSINVLNETLAGLKKDQTAGAWKALVASLEYTVNARIDAPRRPSAATDWLDAQPMTIDNTCGPENNTYGPNAQLNARHGEFIDGGDLMRWPNTVHDCRLVLDGASLSDAYVWAVLVTYRGGELHLHNVRFGQCRFDLPNGDDTNVRKLVSALLTADRNIVTIDLP